MNTAAVGLFLTPAPAHYRPLHTFPPLSDSKEPRTYGWGGGDSAVTGIKVAVEGK